MSELHWIIRKNNTNDHEPLPDLAKEHPVWDGYGYYGVLLYDPIEDKVQCHICGKWFYLLGGTHTVRMHDLSAEEYCEMFELGNLGLCGVGHSSTLRENAFRTDLSSKIKNPVDFHFLRPSRTSSSLRSLFRVREVAKSKERNEKVRQAALKRFSNPEKYNRQVEIVNKIRPLSIKATKGIKKPKEWGENISRKLKGRIFSPETIERMKVAAKLREEKIKEKGGRNYSQESIQRMKEIAARRKKDDKGHFIKEDNVS